MSGRQPKNDDQSNGRADTDLLGYLAQWKIFLRNFARHPSEVGWFLPSSRFLVNGVLRQVDWRRAGVIVEYGPGLGNFTSRILQRMRPDACLIALEINPEFVCYLQSTIQDRRLRIVKGSAAEVASVLAKLGCPKADCVISGIPFKTLPPRLRDEIVRATHDVLRPKGSFLVYQISTAVLPHLEQVFGTVSRDVELLNIVPAQLFYCAR